MCRWQTLVILASVTLAICIAQSPEVHSRRRSIITTGTEVPTTNDHVTYAPVTLSSLATFARRFWTTMASMAAANTNTNTDSRLKREDSNGSSTVDDNLPKTVTTTTTIVDATTSNIDNITGVTEQPNKLKSTSGPKNEIQPRRKSQRRNRKNYLSTTFAPPSATTLNSVTRFRNHPLDGNDDFLNDRHSNLRPERLFDRGADRKLPSRDWISGNKLTTTPCNDTTPVRGPQDFLPELELNETPWPRPPQSPPSRFVKEDFSTSGVNDDNDGDRHREQKDNLENLFTSEPPAVFYSTDDGRGADNLDIDTDFEELPGIASPLSTEQSLLRDYSQSVTTNNSSIDLESTTDTTLIKSTSPSNSDSIALKEIIISRIPQKNREPLTESAPTPDTEVSLIEIFDQDIIDNKTLLAASMFKLSSILTASLLTEETEAEESATSSTQPTLTTTRTTTVTSDQLSDINATSGFDFSSLFATENVTTSSIPSTGPINIVAVPPLTTNILPTLNDDVDEVVLLNPSNVSSTKLESLVSSGLVKSFGVQQIDGQRQIGHLVQNFEDAELVQQLGSDKDQTGFKTLNRFSAQIRSPAKNATNEPGECLFNVTDQGEQCDWTFDSESSVHWSFGLGETAFMSGGPSLDSNGQTDGGYAFMDTSCGLQGPSNEIQRGSLESPLMSKTAPHGRCFTFWYNIGGLSADRLRVLLIPEEQFHATGQVASRMPSFTVLWERKDTTNGTWMKGEILYTFSKEHRLIFEGFARSGSDPRRKFQGYLAVDDLLMDADSCKAFCTFEGVLCEWENDLSKDDFDWELARGSDSHLTGPVRDHGDGPEGGFMFIDTAFPRRPGDVARLQSPELPPSEDGPVCFRFWTHMYGSGIGTLRVVLIDESSGDGGGGDDRNVIWEVSGESGNSWHMAQVTVASISGGGSYRLSVEGIVGRNALGRIAIDDLSFGPGPCPSSPQSALPLRGDCTFESDECGWVNAGSGDQYDWLRTSSGQALLPGQGPNSGYRPPEPLSDHTTGLASGFFLTMERSTIPPRGGDQAYVVGPTLHGGGGNRCFSFWSYMHERSVDAAGPGLGSLRVYLRVGSSSILRPVWRLINYEHPDWFFAQAPINTQDKFQVVIGGTWGSTRQGAISVDDFTFFEGNCTVIPAEAEVVLGECTFDSNMCEWNSGANRSREHSTWQLATNVRRPSNLDDHTYRATAGYVFFDIFSQQPHVVRLESPEIVAINESLTISNDEINNNLDAADDSDASDDNSEHCLTFWFAPFGSSRNTFLRILQMDTASNNETQLWEVTTANFQAFRPEWVYGQVALNKTYSHKIVFEGSSNNGGFALDDIMFVPGTCQSRPENSQMKAL